MNINCSKNQVTRINSPLDKKKTKLLLTEYLGVKPKTDLYEKFTFIFLRILKNDLNLEITDKMVDMIKKEFIKSSANTINNNNDKRRECESHYRKDKQDGKENNSKLMNCNLPENYKYLRNNYPHIHNSQSKRDFYYDKENPEKSILN